MFIKKKVAIAVLSTFPILGIAETTVAEASKTETIVVTATMIPKKIEDVPAFSTVLSKEDINNASVSSVADLLRETAGVNNYTDASGRDEIQIRGLGGEYTVVLVNGKRVSSEGAFDKGSDAELNAIPMGAIERIEIIRGPMSVLYGADAIGGVVNIITKTPQQGDAWTGMVKTGARVLENGDGGSQYRTSFSAQGPVNDQVSLSFAGESFTQDPWYEEKGDIYPSQEEKTAQNFITTLTWKVTDKQSLDFDFGYNNDERPYQMFSETAYREQEISSYDFGITHAGNWDWGKTTAFIKREMSDVYDYNSQYDAPQEHDGLEANNNYAKFYAFSTLGKHSLLAGADYTGQEIVNSYTYLDTGEFSSDGFGLFVQDEIAFTDNLALTIAARVDEHEIYGTNFSPKVYLVYGVTDSITVKGGVTKAFKAPDASKLSEEYTVISCGGGCYLSGNPDLEAETSISYELGVDYNSTDFTATASIFRNEIDNLIEREIEWDDNDDPVGAWWINVAEAMTQGVELTGSWYINSDLTVNANYTFLDTEATDSDGVETVLEGRAKHQVNTSVDYQVHDMIGTFLSANYINGMEYEDWVSGVGSVYKELPSYYRIDLGVNAYITDDFVARVGVKNLGDVVLSNEDAGYTMTELGRNYYFSIESVF